MIRDDFSGHTSCYYLRICSEYSRSSSLITGVLSGVLKYPKAHVDSFSTNESRIYLRAFKQVVHDPVPLLVLKSL